MILVHDIEGAVVVQGQMQRLNGEIVESLEQAHELASPRFVGGVDVVIALQVSHHGLDTPKEA